MVQCPFITQLQALDRERNLVRDVPIPEGDALAYPTMPLHLPFGSPFRALAASSLEA